MSIFKIVKCSFKKKKKKKYCASFIDLINDFSCTVAVRVEGVDASDHSGGSHILGLNVC